MRRYLLPAVLVVCSCQEKITPPKTKEPQVKPLSPTPLPVVSSSSPAAIVSPPEPVSTPASEPASRPALVPVSLPTSLKSTERFAVLEPSDDERYQVTHPSAEVQKLLTTTLDEARKKFNKGCEVIYATTALISFFCVDLQSSQDLRAYFPDYTYGTYNYTFIDGALRELKLSDIIAEESPEFTKWKKSAKIDTYFLITKDGVTFPEGFAFNSEDAFDTKPYPKMTFKQDAAMLHLDQYPLSTIAQTEEPLSDFNDDEIVRGDVAVSPMTTESLPEGLVIEGSFIEGQSYRDKTGLFYVVISSIDKTSKDGTKHSRYLYANRYTEAPPASQPSTSQPTEPSTNPAPAPQGLIKERLIIEKQEGCTLKNIASFAEESLRITDIDRDQIAEVSAGFRLGCVEEDAPTPFKVVVAEGATKYILKGNTQGDEFTPNYNFPAAPPVFLRFASYQWKRLAHFPLTPTSSPAQ